MIEEENEDQNNYEENLDNGNQDDSDNDKQIKLNPNRKKVLNRNQENNDDFFDNQNNDFNQNNNENFNDFNNEENKNDYQDNEMNQPNSNVQINKDSNATEQISNMTMGHLNKCLGFIGKYFDVELNDIKLKLKGAILPFNKSFYQSIEINADLYGPFWIFTTIIFLIALIGSFTNYMNSEDKEKFVYNYNHVPHAVFIIYGFGFGAPLALWIISKFIFRIDIDLITNMCVYGYSYAILIPVLLICIIPFKLVSTLSLLYFLIHSCAFLFYNMILIIQNKAPKSKFLVIGLIGGIQFTLFLLLKFYFF